MDSCKSDPHASSDSPRFNLVFGLLCKCPGTLQPDCILSKQRQRGLREGYEWARSLSEAELDRIYRHHRRCLARQLAHSKVIPISRPK